MDEKLYAYKASQKEDSMYTITAEVVVYTVQKCFTQKAPYSSAGVYRGRIRRDARNTLCGMEGSTLVSVCLFGERFLPLNL